MKTDGLRRVTGGGLIPIAGKKGSTGMKPELDTNKSIYLQIAESIKDDILNGNIEEEEQVASTNQLAAMYRINPATAAKGINLLVSEEILYKKRGIGMFVATGAVKKIRIKRKTDFYEHFIVPLLAEASSLGISQAEILKMITDEREG